MPDAPTPPDAPAPPDAPPPSCQTDGFCHFFVATATRDQATTASGIASLDDSCNTDVKRPVTTSTYKAFLVDGTTRVACTTDNCMGGGATEHVDWVLKPSREYRRLDGTTVIGTTNEAGLLTFPLTNSVEDISQLVVTNATSTGMTATWTTSANTCNGWTTAMAGVSNAIGLWDATSTDLIGGIGSSGCSNVEMFLCVEQ
ncbi:MAG: DUF1554 domain-containing protein [Kofleriaceae bacterium]